MRYIGLMEEEKFQFEDLQKSSINHAVRQRYLCLLLSEKKNSMIATLRFVDNGKLTTKRQLDKWDCFPNGSLLFYLFPLKGQGAKVKLEPISPMLSELKEVQNRNLKPMLEKEQLI